MPEANPTADGPTLGVPVRIELPPEEWTTLDSPGRDAGGGGAAATAAPRAVAGADDGERTIGRAAGRYAVEDEIGRGGMGIVYRAFDRDLRRHVAMKVLRQKVGPEREVSERFVEEAQATAQLQHPGIVPVYEIGLTGDGKLFFTMKLVRGRTLADVLDARHAGDAATLREFTLFRVLQVFVEVARTIAYAHARGVVHRDLKPSNVMIGRYGEVQVMDWGLAKVLGPAPRETPSPDPAAEPPSGIHVSARGLTLAGTVVGTPGYMAPEQAEGDPALVGPSTDIYALGAILYRVLTGRAPFAGGSEREILERTRKTDPARPRALDASVPRELEAVCLRALARDPAARYPTAQALADDVQAWLEGLPVSAFPEGLAGRTVKWAKRHRRVTSTIAVAVGAGLVLAFVALVRIEGERRRAERALRVAESERVRAEAGEREARANLVTARRNLARALFAKADSALADKDVLAAESLFARSLALDDTRETRERLVEARVRGARLAFATRPVEQGEAWALAFSPDGRVLASAEGSSVRLRDAATGKLLRTLRGHRGKVLGIAFSPDGLKVASRGRDQSIRLFDVGSGRMRVLATGVGPGQQIAFGADGGLLYGVGTKVQRVDPAAGGEARTRRELKAPVSGVAASTDGRRIAAWTRDAVHVTTGETEGAASPILGHPSVTDVAFSPDGRHLASAGRDERVRIWDIDGGKEVLAIAHHGPVWRVAFTANGRRLASAGVQGVRIFEVETWREEVALRGHDPSTRSVAFSPDGGAVAAGASSGVLRLWVPDDSEEGRGLRGHAAGVLDIASSEDGRRLATGGADAIRIWDPSTGRVARVLGARDTESVSFAPDARRLASASPDLRVFDVEAGAEILHVHGGTLEAVAFSPDGRCIASLENGSLRLHEMPSGREIRTHPVARSAWLTFTPDGTRIAARGVDGNVRLFDVATGTETATSVAAATFAFHPRRPCLAAARSGGAIALVDLETGAEVLRLEGHEGAVRALAFGPDGRRLASAGAEGTVRLWDLETGREIAALRGHDFVVTSVVFGPDGRWLASGSLDRTARIWHLDAIERVLAASPRDLAAESERRTGLRVDERDQVVPVGPD